MHLNSPFCWRYLERQATPSRPAPLTLSLSTPLWRSASPPLSGYLYLKRCLTQRKVPQVLEFGNDSDCGEDVFRVFLKGIPYSFVSLCRLKHGASFCCQSGKWENVLISQLSEPFVVVWRQPKGKWENVTWVLPFHHWLAKLYFVIHELCQTWPQWEGERANLAQWPKIWLWKMSPCHDFSLPLVWWWPKASP